MIKKKLVEGEAKEGKRGKKEREMYLSGKFSLGRWGRREGGMLERRERGNSTTMEGVANDIPSLVV